MRLDHSYFFTNGRAPFFLLPTIVRCCLFPLSRFLPLPHVLFLPRRQRYESVVGTFDKALPLDTSFFRESWGELERLVGNSDRDAPIMTYCTGGIRCVKVGRCEREYAPNEPGVLGCR